jgi:hypothetical protein
MDPIATHEGDEESPRASVWRVARWLIGAAAALLLATLFLSQATTTEAAAVPSPAVAVSYQMTTCPAGYNCAANNCIGGNFCGYGYNFGLIGASYPLTYAYNPAYIAGNYCPSGNFTACYAGNVYYAGNTYCPSGNFTACYNGVITACPSGNYSCYYSAYPWLGANVWNGGYPWYGVGYANYPYGYTGTYSGQTTIVVPAKGVTVVGPPVYVKEAAPAAPTTVTAAPVAPTAGMATAMNAPAAAPVAGAGTVKAFSAPPATAPGVQIDPSDQR